MSAAAESELGALRELADDIFGSTAALDVPRRAVDFDSALWATLRDAGLTLLTTPEDAGGSGAGLPELALVLDRAGYHAAPIPLADNDILASWLLVEADLPVPHGPTVAAVTDRSLDGHKLTAAFDDVAWLTAAEHLVIAGPGFVAILSGDQFDAVGHLDIAGQPRGRADVDLDLDLVLDPAHYRRLDTDLTSEFLVRGAWARSVQTCGALSRALELTCAHVTHREQFGRPLAKFQAVQDLVAGAAGALAVAKAAADHATDVAERSGFASEATEFAVAVAKIQAARAATVVSRNAHQAHGAIGFTLDHQLRHFTTRALAWRSEFGAQRSWERRLGLLVLAGLRDGDDVWAIVTKAAAR